MQHDDYRSFLIRMWRRARAGKPDWLLLVENPHTGERHHFDDLSALVAFLEQTMMAEELGDNQLPHTD